MPQIRKSVQDIKSWLVETRRDIHRNPEKGYQEVRTSGLVAENLKKLGLEVRTGVGQTGVIGLWRANRPGKCIGLRADMDALGMQEPSGKDWASVVPGVMHACGHDMHTATLLGVARVLAENPDFKDRLSGSVKLIFQPAEEGGAGADAMIADGALEDPQMDAIFAGHVVPILQVGQFGVAPGVAMAAVDNFYIEVKGRGGHAAHPELAADPIAPAAEYIRRIKAEAKELDRALIGICTFSAGTQTNIIPDAARLSGTIRSLHTEDRQKARDLIPRVAKELGKETGLDFSVTLEAGYPMLVNDDRMLDFLVDVAGQMAGPENIVTRGPSYGAEDMAYFLQKIPGVAYWLGCGRSGKEPVAMLHSPEFDPDEDALPAGVELMIRLAESFLGSEVSETS